MMVPVITWDEYVVMGFVIVTVAGFVYYVYRVVRSRRD